MKLLLLGCNGQVGWELQRSLLPLGEVLSENNKRQLWTPPGFAHAFISFSVTAGFCIKRQISTRRRPSAALNAQ